MAVLARDFLNMSIEEMWATIQPGQYEVLFDDGVTLMTNHKELLYSRYFWAFHQCYPALPLLSRHHVSHILKGKMLNSETHMRLLEVIYWDTVEKYQLNDAMSRKHATKLIYDVTNNIYNDLTVKLEEYVVSIDVLDFIEVIDHPVIKEATDQVKPYKESIKKTYEIILDQLQTSPDLNNNALAIASRAKMVNNNQVLQCVGPRGFLTEVDGDIMSIPILRSFTKGMRSLYNQVLESRSAAKSLYFSEAPLQDTDYFARKLQLMTTAVEKLHYTDCGSTDYLVWRVRGEEMHGEDVIYKGDLNFIVGKYYLDEESQTLKVIKENDTHLIGKSIKLRTVLGCKHSDNHGVCAICFGDLSKNISPYANLGHVCAATMTQQTMQSVLSTKHLDASSSSEAITLDEIAKRFFKIGNKENAFFLKPEWRGKDITIVVSQEEAYGLTDILMVENVMDINPMRVSGIEIIEVIVKEGDVVERHPILVKRHGRRAMLSNDFLQYLKLHGWSIDDNNNYILDFERWDFAKPLLTIPQKEYSYAKHAHEISKIIESRIKDITSRSKPDSPKSTLVELFELVNSKLNVNIACLEVIIYAIMCRDIANDKFGLTHHTDTPGLGVTSLIIKNRSLSAAYAYEIQAETINDPRSFFKFDRSDIVFDVFIAPDEVVKHQKMMS